MFGEVTITALQAGTGGRTEPSFLLPSFCPFPFCMSVRQFPAVSQSAQPNLSRVENRGDNISSAGFVT